TQGGLRPLEIPLQASQRPPATSPHPVRQSDTPHPARQLAGPPDLPDLPPGVVTVSNMPSKSNYPLFGCLPSEGEQSPTTSGKRHCNRLPDPASRRQISCAICCARRPPPPFYSRRFGMVGDDARRNRFAQKNRRK